MKTFADYQEEVLRRYRKKKGTNQLSLNLMYSTAAKLRNECEVVAVKRYLPKDENTLRSFFGQHDDVTGYVSAIKRTDADKFKPLDNYLKGNTESTDEKNVELLAWLIDFEQRPYRVGSDLFRVGDSPGKKDEVVLGGNDVQVGRAAEKLSFWTTWRTAIIVGLVLLAGGGVFMIRAFYASAGQGCMVWASDHYQRVSCSQLAGEGTVLALDTAKVAHFKKIMREDTITARALGRVWYSKIDNNVEFFTADGYHPVHTERHLKPLTLYMLNKYVLHK